MISEFNNTIVAPITAIVNLFLCAPELNIHGEEGGQGVGDLVADIVVRMVPVVPSVYRVMQLVRIML